MARRGFCPEGPPEPSETIWNLSKGKWEEAFEELEAGEQCDGMHTLEESLRMRHREI